MPMKTYKYAFSWSVTISAMWLVAVMLINWQLQEPLQNILPYAVPVFLVAYRHTLPMGLLFAACATAIAGFGDAITTTTRGGAYVLPEWLFTYMKLTTVAVGVCLGQMLGRRKLARAEK